MRQSVSQLVDQSVSQCVSQLVRQSVSQAISQSVSPSVSQSVSSSVSQLVCQSLSQSDWTHAIHQWSFRNTSGTVTDFFYFSESYIIYRSWPNILWELQSLATSYSWHVSSSVLGCGHRHCDLFKCPLHVPRTLPDVRGEKYQETGLLFLISFHIFPIMIVLNYVSFIKEILYPCLQPGSLRSDWKNFHIDS